MGVAWHPDIPDQLMDVSMQMLATGVGDHLDEFGHLGNVEVGNLLLHHLGRHAGHAGKSRKTLRHVHLLAGGMHGGVAQPGELEIVHVFLGDDVHAPEGEEDVGLDPFAESRVRHH